MKYVVMFAVMAFVALALYIWFFHGVNTMGQSITSVYWGFVIFGVVAILLCAWIS